MLHFPNFLLLAMPTSHPLYLKACAVLLDLLALFGSTSPSLIRLAVILLAYLSWLAKRRLQPKETA